MKYSEFESIFSRERTYKYLNACGGNSRKAMTLYRYNLRLSNVRECYDKMMRLFHWMDIDANTLLYGLDHVDRVCADIIGI